MNIEAFLELAGVIIWAWGYQFIYLGNFLQGNEEALNYQLYFFIAGFEVSLSSVKLVIADFIIDAAIVLLLIKRKGVQEQKILDLCQDGQKPN